MSSGEAMKAAQIRLPLTWAALCVITLLSWWIGGHGADGALAPNAVVTVSVLLIAALKVRVIFREFMSVRHAPVSLKYLTDGWLILSVGILITVYFVRYE
jgi:hypothetical protein